MTEIGCAGVGRDRDSSAEANSDPTINKEDADWRLLSSARTPHAIAASKSPRRAATTPSVISDSASRIGESGVPSNAVVLLIFSCACSSAIGVITDQAAAVHCIEIELVRVDHKVIIRTVRFSL